MILCECGCGRAVNTIKGADSHRKKEFWGTPRRFIKGHHIRMGMKRGFPTGTLVDPQDAHFAAEHNWKLEGGYVRARSSLIDGPARTIFLHRLILGEPPGLEIDHKNGNTQDNRRENLRAVSRKENGQNRIRLPADNKSGYIGVHWDKKNKKWVSQARMSKMTYFLGRYSDKEEAARVAHEWRLANMPGYIERPRL